MNENNTTSGTANGDVPTTYNVIAVSFEEDVNAYAALTKLKELDWQRQVNVEEAAVVQRASDGNVAVKERVGGIEPRATAGGALLGLLVGVLGGPVGVLIGGYTGLVIGSLIDVDQGGDRVNSALAQIAESVRPERTALLAVVTEPSAEIIDAGMAAFGGTVSRRWVYEVEAEVAAIEEAERKAAREAKLELLRSRRDRDRDAVHAKVEALKAKLTRRDPEPAGSA